MRKLLFRCDNIPETGTNVVLNSLLLADELNATKQFEIAFLTKDSKGIKSINDKGYKTYKIEDNDLEESIKVTKHFSPDIFLLNILNAEESYMEKIKDIGVVLIVFDNKNSEKYADISINSIIETGSIYEGPSYIIMPRIKNRNLKASECRKIFLSLGGYDHLNKTLKVMKALETLDETIEINVIINDPYEYKKELEDFLKKVKRKFNIYFKPNNFSDIINQADIAIISGGFRVFEAMGKGVPSMIITYNNLQTEIVKKYENKGAVNLLGNESSLTEREIYEKTVELIKNKDLRQKMIDKGLALVDGRGLERISDLIRIIDVLKWDTNFFGFKTARLNPLRLTENIVKHAINFCQNEHLDVLYYLSDCHDPLSIILAEKYGFHFTDIRLTFELNIEKYDCKKFETGMIIRDCTLDDIPKLKKIAENSYVDSRYYFDQHYSKEICGKYYSSWIEKLWKDHSGKVFVAEVEGEVLGYISCDKESELEGPRNCGRIILLGVDESARGRKIGSSLVYAALNWFHNEKLPIARVITQGRNYSAQRVYQGCGFKTLLTQLWYHKWFK